MNKEFRAMTLGVLFGVMLMGTACGPEYPKCDDSDDCQKSEQGQKDDKLFCVNGMCQQCIKDADCGEASQECNAGICARIQGYCTAATECGVGEKCQANRCEPECNVDADCGDGSTCEQNRCVAAAECSADADCDPGSRCDGGQCVAATKAECSLETVYFSYDSSTLSGDAQSALENNASCIKEKDRGVLLTGHADERGSEEYNIALGEKRARAAFDYMKRLGVNSGKMRRVSYGEEKPLTSCAESDPDSCHRRNRRVDVDFE